MNKSCVRGLLLLVLCGLGTAGSAQEATLEERAYQLGAGDVIKVTVYGEDDLTQELHVSEDGPVTYAFVGQFILSGKSVAQVESEITSRLLGDYLINPQVSVTMFEYRPFFITGEVVTPGSYPYQPGLTVRQAISIAGGLKERASSRKWFVVPSGGTELDRRRVQEDDPVGPGDTISVEQSFF